MKNNNFHVDSDFVLSDTSGYVDPNAISDDISYTPMSFGSKAYDELAAANPALKRKYGDLTIWDKIGNAFGFKTAEDRFRMNQVSDAAAWDSQIATTKFENEFNSPNSQAIRERAAGVNPDLLGNITPGTAAENTEAENRDVGADAVSDTGKAFNFVQSALSFGLQFMTGLQQVNGIVLDNQGKSIQNILGVSSLAETDAINDFGSAGFHYHLNNSAPLERPFGKVPFKKGSPYFDAYVKRYLGTYNNRNENFKRYFNNRNDFLTALFGSAQTSAHPAFGGIDPDSGIDNFSSVVASFKDFMSDVFNAQKNKAANDADYSATFDGSTAAQAENADNDLKAQQKTMTDQMAEPMSKLIKRLSKQTEEGNVFASAVLMFLYAFQSGSISIN